MEGGEDGAVPAKKAAVEPTIIATKSAVKILWYKKYVSSRRPNQTMLYHSFKTHLAERYSEWYSNIHTQKHNNQTQRPTKQS